MKTQQNSKIWSRKGNVRHKKSNLKTLVSFVEQQPYSPDKATTNRLLGRQVFNLKIWSERAQFYSFIKHIRLESEGAGAFFFFCKVDSQTARNYIYTDILNSMLSIILSYVIIKTIIRVLLAVASKDRPFH